MESRPTFSLSSLNSDNSIAQLCEKVKTLQHRAAFPGLLRETRVTYSAEAAHGLEQRKICVTGEAGMRNSRQNRMQMNAHVHTDFSVLPA